jgi:hypothetical protein
MIVNHTRTNREFIVHGEELSDLLDSNIHYYIKNVRGAEPVEHCIDFYIHAYHILNYA